MTKPPVPSDAVRSLTQLYAVGMSPSAVRRRLTNDTWQMPLPGVVLTRPGPLTRAQQHTAALLWAGPGAALTGYTAAALDGLRGYGDDRVQVMVDIDSGLRSRAFVVVRRTLLLDARHVHPVRRPRRARIERAVVDIARDTTSWHSAVAVVAAAVQQRLTRVEDIRGILEDIPQACWRGELLSFLTDIEGGSHSLPELQAVRALRSAGLPPPDRQTVRYEQGRRRYLDLYWDDYGLCIEIDGRFHFAVESWVADMMRDAEIAVGGVSVVRIPALLVRHQPRQFTDVVARLLTSRGWRTSGALALS